MLSNTNHLSSKYPQSIQIWKLEIEKSADQYDLDPNFLAAVMLQESGGQPYAISSNGAVGLMQIMPRDGIASGFTCGKSPCFINRPTTEDLLDPTFNINYGAQMLAKLIHLNSSPRKALKAYGPIDVGFYYADLVLSIYSIYRSA